MSATNLDQAIKLAWADALDTAIQDKLLDQRAEKRKREIMHFYLDRAGAQLGPDKALEMFHRLEADYLRKLRREEIAASGGEDELRKALQRRGMTMQQWEENLAKELFRRDILAMEMGGLMVRPSEIKEYYDKHPDQFGQGEAWRLRRIRIPKTKLATPELSLQATKMVKESIEKGKDFAAIAAAMSDDPTFASGGGLLTRNGQTDLPSGNFPAEERIAAGLKDNAISDPIDAGDCYVLIQRLGHQDAHTKKFEEVSEKAEALVFAEKRKQKKKEFYQKLKRESFVEIMQPDPPEHLLRKKE